jgi:hypothetical protein
MAKGKRGRPKGSSKKNDGAKAAAAVVKKGKRGRPKGSKNKKTQPAEGLPVAAVAPFKGAGKRGRPAKIAQGMIGNGIRIVDGMALINLTGSKVNRILVIGSDAKTPVTHL